MKKRFLPIMVLGIVAVAAIAALLLQYQPTDKQRIIIEPGFKEYISGYTSGVISAHAGIRIMLTPRFAQPVEQGTEIREKVFEFEPPQKGKTIWIDSQTIEFIPDKPFRSGSRITGKFALHKIIPVEKRFSYFPIDLKIIRLTFRIEQKELKPYSATAPGMYQYEGVLSFSDRLEPGQIEEIVSATQDNKPLPVRWIHDIQANTHRFLIDSIRRKTDDDVFLLRWEGKKHKIDISGSETVEIPGLNNFKLIGVRVLNQPVQHILLTFSDSLDPKQNLDGLIVVEQEPGLKLTVEENQVKAYPASRITGSRDILVSRSIKNIKGYSLRNDESLQLTFEAVNPQVRLIGKGVIIPRSTGLALPFEAVNLKAVDVEIVRIFEDNIPQFLQINEHDGDYQLKRVGRLVAAKKIDLSSNTVLDFGTWNAFSVDISSLIAAEPGAMYRVEIGFRKEYSLYPCGQETEVNAQVNTGQESWDTPEMDEMSYWDNDEDYYYGGYYDYDWDQRDNPCNDAYYRNRNVSRNILASDLGLISKSEKGNTLKILATSLENAGPLAGVILRAMNYQQQIIGRGETDHSGMATIKCEMKPFLVVAEKGNQRGYLKVNDGNSLSLSKFDVGGTDTKEGIKGFLYGERGVWRPGDSLHLTFIMDSRKSAIPLDHPVVFELFRPDGKLSKRLVKASGTNGFYRFSTATDQDDPTGNWLASVKVGGTTVTRYLKIETVKPNRLKIDLDFGTKTLIADATGIRGKLSVKWLHGAIAARLKAITSVTLKATPASFSEYKEYCFDDPAVEFSTWEQTVFEGRTDANGEASIVADIAINQKAPGMLQAVFLTKVFEEGGDFSVDQFTLPYVPHKTLVGIKMPKGDAKRGMLLTDTDHTVEIVTIDPEGNKRTVRGIAARVFKLDWNWWWESGSNNLASYISRSHVRPIIEKTISTTDGYGSFGFRIDYPEWGRYLVQVELPGGHSAAKIVYIDWPGWAGRAERGHPGGATVLTFTTDKEQYIVGETATVSFPGSEGSRALVSIESGSGTLHMQLVQASEEQNHFPVKVTEEMAPNVYLFISLIRPHGNTVNDLPIRMYGVIPLMVNDPNTKLNPVIRMPDEIKPESEVSISVSEQSGKAMTFTVAVVDEGLLALTRFITPDPWERFYAREALGVRTWDMYDYVLGAYGAKIERVFAIGGGDEIVERPSRKAERFKPVVRYFGPFAIGEKGSKTVTFTMPRYVGSVRTMVVAGQNGAFGKAEKTVPVKNPLMVIATLPRVLNPDEKVKVPVTVFAMKEEIRKVQVTVETNDLLHINGAGTQTITFDRVGEKDIQFDLSVAALTGIATATVTVVSGSEKATWEVELEVRPPNPPKTVTFSALVQPGEVWEQPFEIFGVHGTNKATMEVSGMPPVNLERRLNFLIGYPYGCLEQTISSVFPQLYLNKLTTLTPNYAAQVKINIEGGIERLKSFQLPGGGFAYWPDARNEDAWTTSYAGHFMAEAKRAGYAIPSGMLDRWAAYQQRAANTYTGQSGGNDMIQAYRLFTLALAGKPDLGSMNRMRQSEETTLRARYLLASAYQVVGNKPAAKALIASAPRDVDDYRELSLTYGSRDRDRAVMLKTLIAIEMFDEAMILLEQISKSLGSDYWMSTQTTAFCLMALADAAELFKNGSDSYSFRYKTVSTKEKEGFSDAIISKTDLEIPVSGAANLWIRNTSAAAFYVSLSVEGIPMKPDMEQQEKNLTLKYVFRNMNNEIIDPSSLAQANDFRMEVSITNPGMLGDYKELALNTLFPSGWEIINTRLFEAGASVVADVPTYQNIRDDRVYTFFDLDAGRTKTFVFLLNAAYQGEFYFPAIQCEAMYDNHIRARIPGYKVRVLNEWGQKNTGMP